MTMYFYSSLTQTDSLIDALNGLLLSEDEKTHLLGIMESTLHHAIIDAILSELSPEDKKLFLMHLTENDHKKIWEFLNKRIDNIEEKIAQTAEALKKELHKDIQETKEK